MGMEVIDRPMLGDKAYKGTCRRNTGGFNEEVRSAKGNFKPCKSKASLYINSYWEFDVCGSIHLGNICLFQVQLDVPGTLYSLFLS
jgi:hypothetical protein